MGNTPSEREDRIYLDLKGARERLCRAQHHVPARWLGELDQAVNLIDLVGSSVCPQQWSKHDQPEYPVFVHDGFRVLWTTPRSDEALMEARTEAVRRFRKAVSLGWGNVPWPAEIRADLAGKDLACWCPLDAPCHADVLLELANTDSGNRTWAVTEKVALEIARGEHDPDDEEPGDE